MCSPTVNHKPRFATTMRTTGDTHSSLWVLRSFFYLGYGVVPPPNQETHFLVRVSSGRLDYSDSSCLPPHGGYCISGRIRPFLHFILQLVIDRTASNSSASARRTPERVCAASNSQHLALRKHSYWVLNWQTLAPIQSGIFDLQSR